MNILHISPDFNYTCGISKYLTTIFPHLIENENISLFFITNGGDSLERLYKIGLNPYLMKFEKGPKNLFHIRRNLKELKDFCKGNRIDIIHSHHRYPEFLANQLKKKINVKTITTCHSFVSGFKNLSFKSDRIIAVSKAVEKNIIQKYNVSPSKIIQMYNPVDFSKKNPVNDEVLDVLKDKRIILFVGRNDYVKGIDILLEAFKKIEKFFPEVFLVIISDVVSNNETVKSNSGERVILIKPQEDLSSFYYKAELIVLPSRIESFPYVMLEAGIYKKIFIGSNVGGIAEFIEDGKDGLLFENEDSNSLSEKLIHALTISEKEKCYLINNLYNKVKSLISPEEYSRRLVEIYNELIKNQ
jgi:glycosyltransferase involved in cell wall biosynthesis